ncbi:hypothetical protein [Microbaculum sp. FT89]|uniref:hypothetical protein n=1 Tax=Microbaculum sp. FT89 TaxID=3447298 RepID=UPI003F5394B0
MDTTLPDQKLFIHIGAPKTGSTALQRFATASQGRLRELGLLYPQAACRGFGHHDIAFLLDGGYPVWAKPQDESLDVLAKHLATECADFAGDVLLSSEDFYLFPRPAELRRFLSDHGLDRDRDIRIIVYLRRQDELLVSWYNQMVKAQGYSGTFADSLADSTWLGDYRRELDRWTDVFGVDRMVVRRYPGRNAPGELQTDFWSIVCPGILPDVERSAGDRTNISLGRDLLEIQRVINRLPISIVEKRHFHHELMQLTTEGGDLFRDAPVVHYQERLALLERFADGNAAVARTHFGAAELFDDPTRPREAEPVYAGLDLEKALAAMSWLILRK